MTTSWTERTEPSATSYTIRTKPSTTWDMHDSIEKIWAKMDDTWASTEDTWAQLGLTTYTTRTKP